MKHLPLFATVVALTTSTLIARADEIRHCDFEVKARCVSGNAEVTLANGVVTKLEVNVDWCGLHGRLGYSCTVDSSRSEHDAVWSEEGGATVITNGSPFNPTQPDKVIVTVGKKDVSIDMDEAQSAGRCGAGAELPRAIVIPAQKGMCRVSLPP